MKTIQEMLQELSQCIVTVSGEFRFRTNWNGGKVPQPDLDVFDPNVPFCIENVGDVPVEVGLYDYVYDILPLIHPIRRNCKISYNLKSWQDYNIVCTKNSTIPDVNKITLRNNGDRVYIKADFVLPRYYTSSYTRFIVLNQSKDTKIRARGNIISLNKGSDDIYKTDYLELVWKEHNYCFSCLFKDCTSLIQTPELPTTKLIEGCYSEMFSGCTSLTQAPVELPVTFFGGEEGGARCYNRMFYGCTSLTQAPKLPTTALSVDGYANMFAGCTSLTQAPELPATKLADGCYFSMFKGCTSLVQAPELPATKLANYCYENMFQGCTSLTQAPVLPATKATYSCYAYMFDNCTALVEAPELPATELFEIYQGTCDCYNAMFRNCTSLTQPPAKLPAILLKSNCYDSMFQGCTSLTQAPELPATTLAKNCYDSMFNGCTSLTKAPDLPATTLAVRCYDSMFYRCTKLNYVKCLATDTSATDCTKNWLSSVASSGTFECDNKKYFTIDSPNGIPTGWSITEINPDAEKPDLDTFDPNVPFCIENVGDVPVEIGMYDVTSNIRNSCEISYNNKDWITYNLAVDPNPSDIKKIKLQNKGDRVYIKSNHFGTTMSPTPYTRIKVLNESDTTKIQARGNIASLNYAHNDEYKTKYNSTENSCYSGLFMSCKSLIKAPDLVATSLSKSCYMFMFSGCTNLKYIKCLATNISASNCTNEWVRGVASTGDFYTQASTTWSSGISGIPTGWTRHDIT